MAFTLLDARTRKIFTKYGNIFLEAKNGLLIGADFEMHFRGLTPGCSEKQVVQGVGFEPT
jgi:hypothetical protein